LEWTWTDSNYQICSQKGYKMQRTGNWIPSDVLPEDYFVKD